MATGESVTRRMGLLGIAIAAVVLWGCTSEAPEAATPDSTPETSADASSDASSTETAPTPGATAAIVPESDPWAYCATAGTVAAPDDRYGGEPVPDAIYDALATAEELPDRFADPAAREVEIPWRCMDGEVWACDPGANLPCGQADTEREPTEGMAAHCEENPDGVLPAFVTGHETIYSWACEGGEAVVTGQPFEADDEGFVADFWYRLDRPD
ncbi:MAG: hypothetical protein WD734_05655 [Dehalococcoidia bacterium]